MKISKTQFIENLRCERFAALEDVLKNKEQSFVVINGVEYDSEEYEEILTELASSISDDENSADIEKLKILLPQFNLIEVLAGEVLKNKFGYDVISSMTTSKQEKLEVEYDDAIIYSYVDVFQKKPDGINICEVKAMTTNKIWNLGFSHQKEKYSIFTMCEDGICRLAEETEEYANMPEKKYQEVRTKLFDYQHDFGRVILDISYQRFVAERVYGKNNDNYYVGVLNNKYIFDGSYIDGKPNYKRDENGEEIVTLIDVTKVTEEMQERVEILLRKVIDRIEVGKAGPVNLGKHCMFKKTRQCKFFETCWKDVPKINSIFSYVSNHAGFKDRDGNKHEVYDLLNSGCVHMIDVPHEYLHREKNQIQRDCVELDREYIKKEMIRTAVKAIRFPAYHLDFETFPSPLPRFKGEKCYTQSLFQFSIHVEHQQGVCDENSDHFEFLATNSSDQRRLLVEKLIDVIKDDDGSVIVYNKSFEKGRLQELAMYFPEYKTKLMNIVERLYDLYEIINGSKALYESFGYDMDLHPYVYYHPKLSGSFSIKKVLPVFSNLSYSGMEIGNGNDALIAYAKYDLLSDEELLRLRESLIAYCKQDTWAMFVILEELRKIVGV